MRRSLITFGVLAAVLLTTTFKQAVCQNQQEAATPAAAAAKPSGPVLLEDTPIKLRIAQTISSGTSKVNDKVDFEVVEDIKVGDVVVIPQGGTAIATVTEAQPKRRFGRSGKLNVNIDYVRLANGEKAPLRAVKGGSGGSRTGVMTTAVVATAIVFFPAAPLFFFMKGKNIIIPKGTEITAYVAADTPISPAAPTAGQTEVASNAVTPQPDSAAADSSTVVVKSSPDGAEITVDGKFMGTTQSTLRLPSGEHIVKIEKSGYKEWTRSITLSAGGDITIDATLEKSPQ
jgi:hypothetical protein